MGYSRFSTRFRRRGFKKVAVGAKPKSKYAPKKKYPRVSFAKRVNAIIARNVENKISESNSYDAPVLLWTGVSPLFWRRTFEDDFNTQQGTRVQDRIGNKIKLKRWVIKGSIHPPNYTINPVAGTGVQHLPNTYQGCVLVLFMRKVDNTQAVPTTLQYLYQNGATASDPTGHFSECLLKLNTDVYKIYWQRRFKMGLSSSTNSQVAGTTGDQLNNFIYNNNDFKAVRTFGFDATKLIGKNAIIKYNDASTHAQLPAPMSNLCLCAVWQPYAGLCARNDATPISFFQMTANSYYEFEDA